MLIKLDESVPATLQEPLRTLGHDVDTVVSEQLIGAPDVDIWAAAQARHAS
jgi:predicted nuclease of predicted toxin-antitoxin system